MGDNNIYKLAIGEETTINSDKNSKHTRKNEEKKMQSFNRIYLMLRTKFVF